VIRRLLIANRGEIAVRIARAAREMGIVPVGVYSDADDGAMFRSFLDADVRIGPPPAAESYLDAAAIVAAAKTLGADAVHPGYGFLSERAPFAQAVVDAGLIFVGPTPDAIAAMGSKIESKRRVREAGVPVVPGYDGDDRSPQRLRAEAERIGTPLVIKASAGGGGRGMRVVEDLATFEEALASAKREARASFDDDTVLLERYLRNPRHIEFQILADSHGTTLYLGERECSIQRRHQKVIEEAPSVALDAELRARMGAAAVAAAESVRYTNAGTAEFMLDDDGRFYFLEMNARLQVEHPVTELVYGVDLVHEQLRIASGEATALRQATLVPRGWAIEARLNAEDPAHDYLPSIGRIDRFSVAQEPGVRVDTGVRDGSEISVFYDSMIAKIIVWGGDRAAAIVRMQAALAGTRVSGVTTNLPLLRAIVADEAYARGATTTRFLIERAVFLRLDAEPPEEARLLAVAGVLASERNWRGAGIGVPIELTIGSTPLRVHADRTGAGWTIAGDLSATIGVSVHGEHVEVVWGDRAFGGDFASSAQGAELAYDGRSYALRFAAPPDPDPEHHAAAALGSGTVTSPMPGKIVSVNVREGQAVGARTLLVVLEAMKMEHRIEAPLAGTVNEVRVQAGDAVAGGTTLIVIGA
jgi:3-methylcrotonyl-CoA carboxylase alpha subunit